MGILFNVHRFPLDQHGNEQIQVGFILAHGTDILHQSTWGLIDNVVVLAHSKAGQFAEGWKRRKTITSSSYWAVARLFGANTYYIDFAGECCECLGYAFNTCIEQCDYQRKLILIRFTHS